MILAGNVADEIYPFADLIFDALSPESIYTKIKAGLLTCFIRATFPPQRGSGH